VLASAKVGEVGSIGFLGNTVMPKAFACTYAYARPRSIVPQAHLKLRLTRLRGFRGFEYCVHCRNPSQKSFRSFEICLIPV